MRSWAARLTDAAVKRGTVMDFTTRLDDIDLTGRIRIGGKYLELSRTQRHALELATSRLQREALQRQQAQH